MLPTIIELAIRLTQIFVPIIIFTGILSNFINIIILIRPTLNHHPCSLYFLALAITNLFYSSFILIFNLLADGYNINLVDSSRIFCKILSYFLNLCPNLSLYFIVLASIDRYVNSSMNVRIRRFSNRHLACYLIAILIIIFVLFFIGFLVGFDISNGQISICMFRSEIILNRIFLIMSLIIFVFLGPFLMILFGCLTIYNIKQIRSIPITKSRYRRTESQLSRMLFLQVGTHLILTCPFCVLFILVFLQISIVHTPSLTFAFIICKIPFYMTTTTAFFLYVLSARIYRDEFIRLMKKLVCYQHFKTRWNSITPLNIMRIELKNL